MVSSFIVDYGLAGLFLISFLSYSIVPFPYEAAVFGALSFFSPYLVFIVTFVGATLGTLTNYYIGSKGVRRLLPNRESRSMKSAVRYYEKYGPVSLFFNWFPIIGDPLTIVAGIFKMKLWKFILYTSLGKIFYLVLIIVVGVRVF